MNKFLAALAAFAALSLATTSGRAGELVIGQVAPLTGPTAGQARAYGLGIQLTLDAANKAGGVNGQTLVLVQKDDGGQPELTLSQTKELIAERRPVILAGYFGSRGLNALASDGLLAKERIALLGIRDAQLPTKSEWVFTIRASSEEEIAKIVDHVTTVGITQLALLHERGPRGDSLATAIQAAAKRRSAKVLAVAAYDPNQPTIERAVQEIAAAQPQALILASNGAVTANFVERYRLAGGAAQLFATSETDVEQLLSKLADEHVQGMAIAQVVPNPYKISSRLTKEFREAVAAAATPPQVSYAMMEGYVAGRVILEGLRRTKGRFSSDAVAAAMSNLGSVDLGGHVITFRPAQQNGSKYVELSIVSSSGRLRQ
jgi:branched-chain amino acid transport system substrate-binding protein